MTHVDEGKENALYALMTAAQMRGLVEEKENREKKHWWNPDNDVRPPHP